MAFIIPAGAGLTMGTPTDGYILRKSGTTVVSSTIEGATYTKLGADRTTTATTYADVTGLSFSVSAATNYIICISLIVQTNTNATTGIGISYNGPASPTSFVFVNRFGTRDANIGIRCNNSYDAGTAIAQFDATNTNYAVNGTAFLRNGVNAGTFIVRFLSEVNGETVTVKAGSVIWWRTVA